MSSAVAPPSLVDFLASVKVHLDPDQIQDRDLGRCTVDGVMPRVAVAPSSLAELQFVLARAHAARLSVIPVGGGTHLAAGNVPVAYDVALSLARMDRVVAYEPADLTVTVEPGVCLAALQERLAVQGQFLPLDPPCRDAATIGGVLSANASGPVRHAYGTARDWLIGARVVHADGSTSKSGGRVVDRKSVV